MLSITKLNKLNDIVLNALVSRGYSWTEAKQFVKQLSTNKTGIKKELNTYSTHGQKINIFV